MALADAGWLPTVVTPGYGFLGDAPGARRTGRLPVDFAGSSREVDIIAIPGPDPRVRHLVFEHALFSPLGPGKIYCDDGDDRPFATDASKFALFSAAAAEFVRANCGAGDVVHLHDWHAALFCVLREFDPRFAALAGIPCVFTIHNLAMQGIRPLAGDPSSLEAWFPDLACDRESIIDPRWQDCVNPMAAAIRLADRLNTVSPTYAREIQRPNDPERGFHGGEGLEAELRRAAKAGRLCGILNGCAYPKRSRQRPGWRRILDTIGSEVERWRREDATGARVHELALDRIASLPKRRPATVLTSIGRLTSQKADLFLAPSAGGRTALDTLLDSLGRGGVFIMVGSGDPGLRERLLEIAGRHDNFLFLCGYSLDFSDLLYRAGDLFLMPSSFEPCGISQMLAMRDGQPCVVHAVGGLRDTVQDGVNGFAFSGASRSGQAAAFVAKVDAALATRATDPDRWLSIRSAAAAARFTWDAAARDYANKMYA